MTFRLMLNSRSWRGIDGILFEKGCRDAIQGAAEYGCLTNMEWLLEKGCPIDDHEIIRLAVKCGSLHNMKWLFEAG